MKERLLFELYKDTSKLSDKEFKAKLRKKFKEVNISDLHAKIIKYQNKKYGMQLDNHVEMPFYEERVHLYIKNLQRKYKRKKRNSNK